MTEEKKPAQQPTEWVSHGYFVILPNKELDFVGNEFRSTENSYRVGDTITTKSEWKGKVVDIRTGDSAWKMGYAVVIVIDPN